jgi:hypothetical protein
MVSTGRSTSRSSMLKRRMPPKAEPRRSDPTGAPRPRLDVAPRPNQRCLKLGHGLREVGVPTTPVMDDLRSLDPEPLRYLMGAHQVVDIHLSSHRAHSSQQGAVAYGCPQQVPLMRTNIRILEVLP